MKRVRLALILLVTMAALFAVSSTALAENGGMVGTPMATKSIVILRW